MTKIVNLQKVQQYIQKQQHMVVLNSQDDVFTNFRKLVLYLAKHPQETLDQMAPSKIADFMQQLGVEDNIKFIPKEELTDQDRLNQIKLTNRFAVWYEEYQLKQMFLIQIKDEKQTKRQWIMLCGGPLKSKARLGTALCSCYYYGDHPSVYFNVVQQRLLEGLLTAYQLTDDEQIHATMRKFVHYLTCYNHFKVKSVAFLATSEIDKATQQHFQDFLFSLDNVRLNYQLDKSNQKLLRAMPYMTKKNINKETLATMQTTPLRRFFTKIELDNEVDLAKFHLFSQEMQQVFPTLPQLKQPVELRLRKLGNYRAVGCYFPRKRSLVIDFRANPDEQNTVCGVNSFIHEYGHAIDHDNETMLSEQEDFLPILKHYQQFIDDHHVQKATYFKTPTEVFARGFEIYWCFVLKHTSFVQSQASYQKDVVYQDLIAHLADIKAYYDKVLTGRYHAVQSLIKPAVADGHQIKLVATPQDQKVSMVAPKATNPQHYEQMSLL